MKVALFGAGTMGRGIAQVFAAKGHTVLMYASSPASAQRHKDTLGKSLQKRVEKGKMAQEAVDALMANVLIPQTHEESADADLVIECVKEDMGTKKELLGELDAICKPCTVPPVTFPKPDSCIPRMLPTVILETPAICAPAASPPTAFTNPDNAQPPKFSPVMLLIPDSCTPFV